MDLRIVLKRSIAAAVSVLVLAVAVQFFASCGSNYEKPSTTQTEVLISAATLSSWMDAGKVNGTGYDRVVILDITDLTTYAGGHVPGALFLSSGDIAQDRIDGVGRTSYEVLEGAKMDSLVQKLGIDGNTTIVFTSGYSTSNKSPMFNVARTYFTFRYWGFPKNRLKVLNGLNGAWPTGGLAAVTPFVAPSTYSVTKNGVLRDDLRVSLSEMIDYADGKIPNAIAIDARGNSATSSYVGYPGASSGPFSSGTNAGKTVFEGRIRGAQAIAANTDLYNADYTFKPIDKLITVFTNIGVDSTKTAYAYCIKGYSSAAAFLVLDGILGWPAAIYDGSWQEWGQLSGNPAMKGQLDPNSYWRTDIPTRSDPSVLFYNYQSPISAVTPSTGLAVTGTPSLATSVTYTITISGAGTPDTFDWIVSGVTTTGVPITSGPILLNNGVSITFQSTTGHVVNDTWSFTVKARQNVEQFTADGSACWATYLASGSTINSSGGSTECSTKPNSWDNDANKIEEEDRAYMQSGGSGASGGGTSVPAGC